MLILWIFAGAFVFFLLQRLLYQKLWNKKLSIRISFDSKAVSAGETVTLSERIENAKWLPLPVFSYEYVLARNYFAMTEAMGKRPTIHNKLALPPRRAVRNRTRIEGLPRGSYSLNDVILHGNDLFYTSKLEQKMNVYDRVLVYPRKIPASKLSLPFRSMLGAVLTRRLSLEDPFQLRGIRPYEIYDSMRDINWKASAKTGELKVNQHEYTTDESLLLLLDLGSGAIEQRETVLSLASSLSLLFLQRGVNVAMWANGRNSYTGKPIKIRSGSGASHQTTIDETLAQIRLTASETAPFPAFLRDLPPKDREKSLPVVISADPEGVVLEAFHEVLGSDNGYYLSVGATDDRQKTASIRVFTWDEDLQEVAV